MDDGIRAGSNADYDIQADAADNRRDTRKMQDGEVHTCDRKADEYHGLYRLGFIPEATQAATIGKDITFRSREVVHKAVF